MNSRDYYDYGRMDYGYCQEDLVREIQATIFNLFGIREYPNFGIIGSFKVEIPSIMMAPDILKKVMDGFIPLADEVMDRMDIDKWRYPLKKFIASLLRRKTLERFHHLRKKPDGINDFLILTCKIASARQIFQIQNAETYSETQIENIINDDNRVKFWHENYLSFQAIKRIPTHQDAIAFFEETNPNFVIKHSKQRVLQILASKGYSQLCNELRPSIYEKKDYEKMKEIQNFFLSDAETIEEAWENKLFDNNCPIGEDYPNMIPIVNNLKKNPQP